MDLSIEGGGVTVIVGPASVARTALLMTLCGRMRLSKGSLTVLGEKDASHKVFAKSSIACFDELDGVAPSVTVQDLITEQIRWESSWYKPVARANDDDVGRLCAEIYDDRELPPLKAFIDDLPEIDQMLLRIAVANTRKPPLLIVGRLDRLADDDERAALLERLIELGKSQDVITADVNGPPEDVEDDTEIIDIQDELLLKVAGAR